jgi:hypothetical protein
MSWQDPKGPWSRKLRRRIWLMALSCLVMLLAPAAPLVMLWRGDALTRSIIGAGLLHGELLFTIVPIVLVPLIFVVVLAHRMRVERFVLKEVPRREGSVCPRCRTLLPQDLAEGACLNCSSAYTRAGLESYWVDYVLEPRRVRPWGRQASLRQKLFGVKDLLRSNIRAYAGFEAAFVLLAVLFMWWVTGISLMGVVFRYMPMFLGAALFGPAFMCLSRYRQRSGQSRHCVACNYQWSPGGVNPDRCPECGARWGSPGGTISGSSPRQTRYLFAACGLFVAAVALMATYATAQLPGGWTLRVLPTAALIRDTTTSGGFTNAEWSEIRRRQLTPKQMQQLAVGLLEKRAREDYLNITEGSWLWTQVSTGALPDDLVERYYREMLELWLEAPARAKVHQQVPVTVGSRYRRSSPPVGVDAMVYFAGFFAGGEAVGPGNCITYAGLLEDGPFKVRLEPTRAGPLQLRAVIYFAVGPRLAAARPSVQWHQDGTITLPAAAVWSRRVELTSTVEVEE